MFGHQREVCWLQFYQIVKTGENVLKRKTPKNPNVCSRTFYLSFSLPPFELMLCPFGGGPTPMLATTGQSNTN